MRTFIALYLKFRLIKGGWKFIALFYGIHGYKAPLIYYSCGQATPG